MSEVWKILVGVTWMFSMLVCLTFLWSILSISCIFPVKYEPSFRSSSWSFHRFKQPTDYWVLSTECRDFWNSNFVTIGPSRWQVEDQEERGMAEPDCGHGGWWELLSWPGPGLVWSGSGLLRLRQWWDGWGWGLGGLWAGLSSVYHNTGT